MYHIKTLNKYLSTELLSVFRYIKHVSVHVLKCLYSENVHVRALRFKPIPLWIFTPSQSLIHFICNNKKVKMKWFRQKLYMQVGLVNILCSKKMTTIENPNIKSSHFYDSPLL